MSDQWIVLTILGVTIALFVSDRLPLDLVALMSVVALMVVGVLTPQEGMQGFANPIVPMIAALFVVGAALEASGVAAWIGDRLAALGGASEVRRMAVLMATSAVLSSFMSSTGTVAILLPAAVGIARRSGTPPARLLMPLAFGSLLGGMLTLIGTPPNMVVNDELRRHGEATFGFFGFAPVGAAMLAAGIAFMAVVGRRLLPEGSANEDDEAAAARPARSSPTELAAAFGIAEQLHCVVVAPDSPLVGRSLGDAALRQRWGVHVLGIRRGPGREVGQPVPVLPSATLRAGDRLRVLAPGGIGALAREARVQLEDAPLDAMLAPDETMAEIVLPRRSAFAGGTVADANFRTRFRTTVLAVQRRGETAPGPVKEIVLQAGDTLLVKGAVKNVRLLARRPRDLVVLGEAAASAGPLLDRALAPRTLAVTAAMIVLMTLQVVPNVVAVLLAAIALVLLRCVTTVEAYQRVNWESVLVVAAVLPMSAALEKTGVLEDVVRLVLANFGELGPRALLTLLFVATSAASQVMSNTATTVLVAPIAYTTARELDLSPAPFLMTVAVAASAAFATPIASPVNTLVVNPGGYRFADFVRVGVPLQVLVLGLAVVVVPVVYPFRPV